MMHLCHDLIIKKVENFNQDVIQNLSVDLDLALNINQQRLRFIDLIIHEHKEPSLLKKIYELNNYYYNELERVQAILRDSLHQIHKGKYANKNYIDVDNHNL